MVSDFWILDTFLLTEKTLYQETNYFRTLLISIMLNTFFFSEYTLVLELEL